MAEAISTSLKPESKLNVYTTMGVDPNEMESGAVRLPVDFVRYVLTAYQKAKELAHGQNFVLKIGQNDFGRLLLANPDLQQVEQVLSGYAEDDFTKKLLDVSRIRNSVVKAVYEIFGLKHVSEPFSVIEMLMQNKVFRQTMMEYFKTTSESFDKVIYADPSKQRPLLAGLISALPRRVRKELTSVRGGVMSTEELERKAKQEVLYPLSEAGFATHVINDGGYYLAQEGKGVEPKDYTTAQILREISSEIRRMLFASSSVNNEQQPAEDIIMQRWRLYSDLDGLAFNTSGGGGARHADPYYAEQVPPDNIKSPESQSYKLLIYPHKEAQRAIDIHIGPDKPGLSVSLREVILEGVRPVLREFLGVPGDGLDLLNNLAKENTKVRNCMNALVPGASLRLQITNDWLSNNRDRQPVFPGDKKQWFISMYMSAAKLIEEKTEEILSRGDVK